MGDDHATIRRLLGDVPVQPLGAGLDHRVYAVGDALVARFGDGVEREAALLSAIAPRLPLPVPVPVAVEAGCVVQPRVPGTSLLSLPRAERRTFVPQLVTFVDVLHSLDPGIDVPEDSTSTRGLARRGADLDAPVPPAPAPVLIHGDLGAEHIFVDAGRITGVIDWGDAAIGDPGLDHGRLLRDFGPIGRGGERARLYAVCTALEDLAYGREPYRSNALAALQELTFRSPWPD